MRKMIVALLIAAVFIAGMVGLAEWNEGSFWFVVSAIAGIAVRDVAVGLAERLVGD